MKANEKRKVFKDAIDLLADEPNVENRIQMIPVDKIVPFHNHPFRLYEGQRLEDMVESVREHGVLNPVIIRNKNNGYEMLSGHNRLVAAKQIGLKEIPAIVKLDLSDEEAYIYIIETNLIQRSFSDLKISEKAAVLKERYDKVQGQRQREKIMREVALLEGIEYVSGQVDHQCKSRDSVGKEYGLSSSSVGRLIKLNDLIMPLRLMLDDGTLAVQVGVQLSFLSEKEQELIYKVIEEVNVKINIHAAIQFRKFKGTLSKTIIRQILVGGAEKKKESVRVKIPADIAQKYFREKDEKEIEEIIWKAIEAWFEKEIMNR